MNGKRNSDFDELIYRNDGNEIRSINWWLQERAEIYRRICSCNFCWKTFWNFSFEMVICCLKIQSTGQT